jgi:PAS domain S-box-containing protein
LNIAAWVLLIRATFFKITVYRKQAAALLFALSLIIAPNMLYVTGHSPVKGFDITPVFFGPAGLIAAWGIFRYKLFDLVPLARATVIETMDAGVIVLDLQDRILDANRAFEKIIGLSEAQIISRGVNEVCSRIPQLAKACTDRNIMQAEFSASLENTVKTYEALLSPLNSSRGTVLGRLALIHEITEEKQAQQEFLRQQWKLAVIEERERMARELHDNLGQVLGFMNLQAQGIRQELADEGIDSVLYKLDRLISVTQSAHAQIREYIRDVRSSAAAEKDFITALNKDISTFEEQTGICVQLDIPCEFTCEELKPNSRINVLNIIKEALNNVRKHASAQNVQISLSIAEGQLSATVEDDGKGFDTLQNPDNIKTRFGLDIMRERALEIGGKIDIRSAAGKGCRVALSIPLEEGNKVN